MRSRILDHRHFGAQTAPDGRQFQPDDAAADDREALGHFRQLKRAGGGHDALLVHLDAGDRDRFGTGGDDDVLGADHLGAAVTFDGDLALGGDAALALEPVDLVLLEQELDAGGVVFDDLVLVGHHGRQVQLDRAELDAMTREAVLGFLELLGTGQQRLGRDAADIEAGAAQRLALFDAGRLQAELCCADGGNVTAGSTADDDNVVGFLRHLFFFASVGSSRAGHALRMRFMALQAARGNRSNCAQTHGNGWIPALPRCLVAHGSAHTRRWVAWVPEMVWHRCNSSLTAAAPMMGPCDEGTNHARILRHSIEARTWPKTRFTKLSTIWRGR